MRLPCDQIVDLYEIELRNAPELTRALDLCRPAFTGRGPHLFGRKQRFGSAKPFEAMSDDRLRRTVHGRAIDHAPTPLEKGRHDFGAFVHEHRIIADIEGDPSA